LRGAIKTNRKGNPLLTDFHFNFEPGHKLAGILEEFWAVGMGMAMAMGMGHELGGAS